MFATPVTASVVLSMSLGISNGMLRVLTALQKSDSAPVPTSEGE